MSYYYDYYPIAEGQEKKEHLNPFGWGDLVAGHYIEDGTRWVGMEEGRSDPQFA